MARFSEWEAKVNKLEAPEAESYLKAIKELGAWSFFSKEFSEQGLGEIRFLLQERLYKLRCLQVGIPKASKEAAQAECAKCSDLSNFPLVPIYCPDCNRKLIGEVE